MSEERAPYEAPQVESPWVNRVRVSRSQLSSASLTANLTNNNDWIDLVVDAEQRVARLEWETVLPGVDTSPSSRAVAVLAEYREPTAPEDPDTCVLCGRTHDGEPVKLLGGGRFVHVACDQSETAAEHEEAGRQAQLGEALYEATDEEAQDPYEAARVWEVENGEYTLTEAGKAALEEARANLEGAF
jgi:hypothetical protein